MYIEKLLRISRERRCHLLPRSEGDLWKTYWYGTTARLSLREPRATGWLLPQPVWPRFDEKDPVLCFGAVGLLLGAEWLSLDWSCIEPDPLRRYGIRRDVVPRQLEVANRQALRWVQRLAVAAWFG